MSADEGLFERLYQRLFQPGTGGFLVATTYIIDQTWQIRSLHARSIQTGGRFYKRRLSFSHFVLRLWVGEARTRKKEVKRFEREIGKLPSQKHSPDGIRTRGLLLEREAS
jgi:hypothetical protein